MRSAETIIIGGGVVGASVAYHLAERGAKDVVLLEREREMGLGSTGKATGGVRAQFETDINIRLSLYSIDFFENFREHTGFECGYDPKGYVFVATNSEQLQYLEKTGKRQRQLGYEDVRMLTPDEISAMVPGINSSDLAGGSFGPRDGFIDPLALMQGLVKRAESKGAKFITGTQVLSIDILTGKVRAVITNRGPISADNVIICAGPWAKVLAATAGVDLPVEPHKRQIVWAECSSDLPPDLPMVIDLSDGFHFRPAANSNREVLFAFPERESGNGFDVEFCDDFIDKVYDRAEHRAPFLCDSRVMAEKCRAGLYENSPDHHAIIGGCEIDGLYFANGFSGHGVMHSPATGRAIAEIVLDGKAAFMDVSMLGIDRFATGELLHETAFI